ncbi:MAG: RNA polymerase sigma factor SigE [Corynebacterium sp.]|nr:RNA polymerase sigma factor SigE [Corynebacterium sp.]
MDNTVEPRTPASSRAERKRAKKAAKAEAKLARTHKAAGAETVSSGTAAFDAGIGEMPSWEELVQEHAEGVYRLAYRLCGNAHDAEDLTQETFMRVFRSLKDYKPGVFEGWLHRITTNLFLDMVRRRNSTVKFQSLPEDYESVVSTDPSPAEEYELRHMDPQLQAALDSLNPDFRVVIVLCDVMGMSYEDIAATLGVKMGTVRSRLHRARAQLRSQLEVAAQSSSDLQRMIEGRV